MTEGRAAARAAARYRFGVFEADAATGELRRKGLRVRVHSQPFLLLILLLERPGEMLTREEICRELWPDGTFVDFEHGVNSAVNRLRDALGDRARSPQFVETLARRGYRFLPPVERVAPGPVASGPVASGADASETGMPDADPRDTETLDRTSAGEDSPGKVSASDVTPGKVSPEGWEAPKEKTPWGLLDRVLPTAQDLPQSSHRMVRGLFLGVQAMYLAFYIGALGNLPEIGELFSALELGSLVFGLLVLTAAMLIPVRAAMMLATAMQSPGMRSRFLTLWGWLLPFDLLWSLAPFLLLHHISYGLALASTTLLVYVPFAGRSLVLMGAGSR